MIDSDFDVTGTETVRQTGQQFLEKLRSNETLAQAHATPLEVASDITGLALRYHPGRDVSFLEPCLGTGIFFSAFLHDVASRGEELAIRSAHGVELDPQFAALAHDLWSPAGLTVHELNFMSLDAPDLPAATLVLSRPPVTPHHRLSSEEKVLAGDAAEAATGIRPAGLAEVYNHFVLATHAFLAPSAVSAGVLPTSFLTHTTGQAVRTYLSSQVRLRRIHTFERGSFETTGHRDDITDWTVVVFTNERPAPTDTFEFTAGGEIFGPETTATVDYSKLSPDTDWQRLLIPDHPIAQRPTLEDFFFIRRGWDIPGEKVLVQPEERAWALGIQPVHMHPMLPSPAQVTDEVIEADSWGYPIATDRQVVLSSRYDHHYLADKDPALLEYLNAANGDTRAAAQRSDGPLWYNLHLRRPAPILVQPAGPQDPGAFRFIINRSDGIAGPGWITMSPNLGFAKPWFLDNDVDWDEIVHVLTSIPAPDAPQKPPFTPTALASLDASAVAEYLATFD